MFHGFVKRSVNANLSYYVKDYVFSANPLLGFSVINELHLFWDSEPDFSGSPSVSNVR